MRKSGTSWSLEYDDGVVVGRFGEDMPLAAFNEEAYPAFAAIVEEYEDEIVGTADLVEVEGTLGNDILSVWEQAAQESATLPNYRRGALVADGIKRLAIQGKLSVPNAEIDVRGVRHRGRVGSRRLVDPGPGSSSWPTIRTVLSAPPALDVCPNPRPTTSGSPSRTSTAR